MSTPLELPAELTIYAVQTIHASLQDWVQAQTAQGKEVLEVSARDVAEVDGAGLQLLAALANGNRSWRLVQASPVFIQACQTLGLGRWLDSPYFQHAQVGEGA